VTGAMRSAIAASNSGSGTVASAATCSTGCNTHVGELSRFGRVLIRRPTVAGKRRGAAFSAGLASALCFRHLGDQFAGASLGAGGESQ
jgi:hypothetical protein